MIPKRAMGVEQAFIFIVVALTFALITIFGYKAIGNFISKGEQVEFVTFKNDVEKAFIQIRTDFGSVRIENFYPPGKYEQVCFVDMNYAASPENIEQLCEYDQLACDVWADAQEARIAGQSGHEAVNENVFLTPAAPIAIKISSFEVTGGFLCKPLSAGKLTLRLEGRGSYTLIT